MWKITKYSVVIFCFIATGIAADEPAPMQSGYTALLCYNLDVEVMPETLMALIERFPNVAFETTNLATMAVSDYSIFIYLGYIQEDQSIREACFDGLPQVVQDRAFEIELRAESDPNGLPEIDGVNYLPNAMSISRQRFDGVFYLVQLLSSEYAPLADTSHTINETLNSVEYSLRDLDND